MCVIEENIIGLKNHIGLVVELTFSR